MMMCLPMTNHTKKDTDQGSIRLVRTASKAFGEGSGGDEKSGCQGKFKLFVKEFLTEHRMKSVPLRSFRGSRLYCSKMLLQFSFCIQKWQSF